MNRRDREPPARPTLVIFAKAPWLGTVKTRLARSIGDPAALAFHEAALATLAGRVAQAPGWATLLAVTPDEALAEAALWPAAVPRAAQGEGDLGSRMRRFLDGATTAAPVVLVGSDIPAIEARHIAAALAALATHDLVFGPAMDGGYWLIGTRARPPADLFAGVRWSTAHALADTLCNTAGCTVALVDELEDVDDLAAYERWRRAAAVQP